MQSGRWVPLFWRNKLPASSQAPPNVGIYLPLHNVISLKNIMLIVPIVRPLECYFSFSRSLEDYTKKWGMLSLVNQLFKVYFRINKLHLCKPLIRAIDSSPFKDHFALGQRVTYRYYVGRKAMFDSDYKVGKCED